MQLPSCCPSLIIEKCLIKKLNMQGRRNSIISGEATSNIANFFALFPQKLVCQPLISGEAGASPASPVPTPLILIIHDIQYI